MGVEEAEFSWILESNAFSRGSLEGRREQDLSVVRWNPDTQTQAGAGRLLPACSQLLQTNSMSDLVINPYNRPPEATVCQFPVALPERSVLDPAPQQSEGMANYRPHPFYRTRRSRRSWPCGRVCGRIRALEPLAPGRYNDGSGSSGSSSVSMTRRWPTDCSMLPGRGWADRIQIRGPVSPSLNYEVGLLIDRFPPTFMMATTGRTTRLLRLWFSQGAGSLAYEGVEMLPRMRALRHIVEHMIKEYGPPRAATRRGLSRRKAF